MHCQGLKLQERQHQAIQGSAQVAKGDSCCRNKSPETNSNQNTQSLRNMSPLGRRILPKLRSDACSTCNVIWDWILSAVRSKKPFLFLATPPSLQVQKALTLNGSHSRQSPPAAWRRPASGMGEGAARPGEGPSTPTSSPGLTWFPPGCRILDTHLLSPCLILGVMLVTGRCPHPPLGSSHTHRTESTKRR